MNLPTQYSPLTPTRWTPLKELADFERSLERFFGRAPAAAGNGTEAIESETGSGYQAPVPMSGPALAGV